MRVRPGPTRECSRPMIVELVCVYVGFHQLTVFFTFKAKRLHKLWLKPYFFSYEWYKEDTRSENVTLNISSEAIKKLKH